MEVDTLIDFTDVPVIDNHCHPLDPEKATLEPEALAREFYHGMGDVPENDITRGPLGATPELRYHFSNLGVVHTAVCQLSKLFDCPAELEVVAFERNRRTVDGLAGYARLLYEDAGIVGTVLDTGLPPGDPLLDLMPGRVMRLFQMGPAIGRLLEHAQSYQELLRNYQEALDRAVRVDGFVGVKAHLAEEVGFGVEPASRAEAEAVFFQAKEGEPEAHKKLYVAIFTATLLQCQDLWGCLSTCIAASQEGCGTARYPMPTPFCWPRSCVSPLSGSPKSSCFMRATRGSSTHPRLRMPFPRSGWTSDGSRPGSPCAL